LTKKSNIGLFWSIFSSFLELAGISSITFGFYLFSPILGFIVGGIGLILIGVLIGFSLEPPKRQNQGVER